MNFPNPPPYNDDNIVKNDISNIQITCKTNPRFKYYECSFCKRNELIEIKCMWCKELMCIKHKFPTHHNCVKQKKKMFHKQTVKNDIKRMTNREKKLNNTRCVIQ